MKLYLATDHRGVSLKEEIKKELTKEGYEIILSKLPNDKEDDYVDFAFDICKQLKKGDIGILICGNGIGMSIAANKVKGIRCARVTNEDDAKKAKEHNDANVIALGANLGLEKILSIINAFIKTPEISLERNYRRVNKIIDYENGAYNEL